MSLSSEAQALFDHARNSLPSWLTGAPNAVKEWLYGFTEIFDVVRSQGQEWLDITYLESATGAELDQHAADRGTSRRAGESDYVLRTRLRQIDDALTEPALIRGTDQILSDAARADLFVFHFTDTGWNTVFEAILYGSEGGLSTDLSLTMIDDAVNPPQLTEVDGATTIRYAAGVTTRQDIEDLVTSDSTLIYVKTGTDSPVSVVSSADAFTDKHFILSQIVSLRRDRGHMHITGECTAFMSNGYRMTGVGRPMGYIVILPYGTDSATAGSVSEYLRKNGPAGFISFVERRLNP